MIYLEIPSIHWKQLILLIFLVGGLNCKKPETAPPPAQIKGSTDYAALLKEQKWGFTKGDAPPHPEYTIDFRYSDLELHDGPLNYTLPDREIKCLSNTCVIVSNGEKIFWLRFVAPDLFVITSPWVGPKGSRAMHEGGGELLRTGDKFKPVKAE